MVTDEEDDIVEEILEEDVEDEEEEEDDGESRTRTRTRRIIRRDREDRGLLSNLTKEDAILVILLLLVGIAIGYVLSRLLNRKDRSPYMPVFRNMGGIPNAPPPIHNIEAPLAGRKHRGKKIDVETGDLILDEPHQQEYWVVKRSIRGDIIDLYMVDTDEELR